MTTTDEELRRHALRRVKLKTGFYMHALVYLLVNLGLWVVNWASGGPRWHGWALAGWGLGLAIHGIVTVVKLQGGGLREKMLEQELQRLKERERR